MYVYMYVFMYVCMHVSMSNYTYIPIEYLITCSCCTHACVASYM